MRKHGQVYRLIRPNESYAEEWEKAINALQEKDGKIIPSNLSAENFTSFLNNIQNLAEGKNLPKGYVTSELYFLVENEKPDIVLGVTDIRLGTTPAIEQYFGHAGGCIIPKYRKQGLCKHIIGLSLDVLRQKGFKTAVLTCETWNEGSRKSIIFNGGTFVGTSSLAGKTYERYLINL